jgi:hypothetical protein
MLHQKLPLTSVINLIYLGIELVNDFQKLSQINRFSPNSVIHITHNRGGVRVYSSHEENIKNIDILLRNAEECNKYAKRNIDSRERQRFSNPSHGAEIDETFQTFGDLTERIGNLMVSYSTQLHRFADVLSKDESMRPGTRRYIEAGQIITNNIDTAKYVGPMMKNFSSTKVNMTNNSFNSP